MKTQDSHSWRPAIFLLVLMVHFSILLLVARSARLPSFQKPIDAWLILHEPDTPAAVPVPSVPRLVPPRSAPRTKKVSPPTDDVKATPDAPPQPRIDWEQETILAANNAIHNAEVQNRYRDLSALSAAQLKWARENHFESAPPGIPWTTPRVEIVEGGLPIIHINDHCVLVPFLMMMVFCKIGHIEPKGDLFNHLHREPNP